MSKLSSEKKLKKLEKARAKGFWVGYRGEVDEDLYRQGSKRAAYYKQGILEGHNFRLGLAANG